MSNASPVANKASYLGPIPRESSSEGKQRMGAISKQGNRLLRVTLAEAANSAARFNPHDAPHSDAVPKNRYIETSLACTMVGECQTVSLSRRSRTQHRPASE
jgi:hypothetical protein